MSHKLIYITLLSSLIFFSCEKNKSKIWAHRVNDITSLHEKQKKFQGLEIDLIYSPQNNELFVGHDFEDSSKQLTFHTWLKNLDSPTRKNVWIDIKDVFLNKENANAIAQRILQETTFYKMNKNFFVECRDAEALQILKSYNIPICLWLDDIADTANITSWFNYQKQKIEKISPQAISCEYKIVNFVARMFPDLSIYTWHTPMNYTQENILQTKKIANIPNVKIVLVDYPVCITY